MDNNKIIIIALIAIIIALLVGIAFTKMPTMSKMDTKLIFRSNDTIDEGDYLKIKLTDVNGTELQNQTVNITITDENNTSDYHSVVTDENGDGKIKVDKDSENYTVTISYGGNDNYNGCNTTKKITIKEEVVQAEPSNSNSQTSSTPRYTTDSHGTYDNYNDMYIDGQGKGMSKSEVQDAIDKIQRDGGMI